MGEAFYEQIAADGFRSTDHTVGPWSLDSQHMGPPAALLVRELERCAPRADAVLCRLVFEVLGPVPISELTVRTAVERPGRSVELLGAEILVAGRLVVRARAWRVAHSDTSAVAGGGPGPLPAPERGTDLEIPSNWRRGYLEATQWRAIEGGMNGAGRATVWGRTRVDVVQGEEASPLQRLCAIADSANGLSARLDGRAWLFINTDLSIHLHTQPAGDWFALDAETVIGPTGAGLSNTTLHDIDGPVGRSAQCLLVRPQA
ncbi:MAG TPA: thioesterase family protein [Actinocrinis sp.]